MNQKWHSIQLPSLPSADTISQLLLNHPSISIEWESGPLNRDYLKNLRSLFPAQSVGHLPWNNTLIISPAIHTATILENIHLFWHCIWTFDQLAHRLMAQLAEKYGLEPGNPGDLQYLKLHRSEKQRGKLGTDWTYWLHGTSCTFTHTTTGQMLDVKCFNKDTEYGILDTFYLSEFIRTTSELQPAAKLIDGETANMVKVLYVLETEGYLSEQVSNLSSGLILNRNAVPPKPDPPRSN